MLSAVKNHFRFKEASFVGIKLENRLPSLCSNNIQIATCHLQLSFYKRSANSKNKEQILALERRTGFSRRRTESRSTASSLFCSPRVFIPAKRALRPLMLFSAMRPTEGGITSSRQRASLPAGGRLASYSALSDPPATPNAGLLFFLTTCNLSHATVSKIEILTKSMSE